jgi:hypothetical protein
MLQEKKQMPKSTESADSRRRDRLAAALRTTSRALRSSSLPSQERGVIVSQINALGVISNIARPDWGHIESLVKRLLWQLGDRIPGASDALCAWTEENTTQYQTAAGNWLTKMQSPSSGEAASRLS